MGRGKDLTSEQLGMVRMGQQVGLSYRAIAEQVGCSKTAVGNALQRLKESGTLEPKTRPGRAPLLQTPERKRLKTLITNRNNSRRRLYANQLTSFWTSRTKEKVSTKTVRRALHKENLYARVARKKPAI